MGLYSPAANAVEFERFVQHRMSWLTGDEFTPEDRVDAALEIRELLSDAVVVEVLVSNADERFDLADFAQADPNQPKSEWQVAWNETYLSADGNSVLGGYPCPEAPEINEFRVVFVIHYWKSVFPLLSSYGELIFGA